MADFLVAHYLVKHATAGVLVGEQSFFGIETLKDLHHVNLGFNGLDLAIVCNDKLGTMNDLALETAGIGFQGDGANLDTHHVFFSQFGNKFVAVDKGSSNNFKGQRIAHTNGDIIQLADDTGQVVVEGGFGAGHIGRTGNKGQSGIPLGHGPLVALHGHHGQIALHPVKLLVEEHGGLAGGQAVHIGNGV